jgi:hypothetical protein
VGLHIYAVFSVICWFVAVLLSLVIPRADVSKLQLKQGHSYITLQAKRNGEF